MDEKNGTWGSMIGDVVLLATLLAGCNAALAGGDIGWLELNPTPWLLAPLLIGARYGVWAGTVTGLLTAAGVALMRSRLDNTAAPWDLATQHRYPLASLVIAGFLAGECNRLLRNASSGLSAENHRLRDQALRLKAELDVARETRHDLQRELALHNVSFACLDVELRKLVFLPRKECLEALLHLLHRLANVTSAGFYLKNDAALIREAVIHPVPVLADELALGRCPLAARALAENAIAALMDPFEMSRSQPFLAAIPWHEEGSTGALLIQDMPAESFGWQNLARMEVVLHWTSALRRFARANQSPDHKEAPLEDFLVLLAQALETEQAHCLPSTVVRIDFANPDEAKQLKRQIISILPDTAIITRLPGRGLAALLPFVADHEGEAISGALHDKTPEVRVSRHMVTGPATLEEVWSRILES